MTILKSNWFVFCPRLCRDCCPWYKFYKWYDNSNWYFEVQKGLNLVFSTLFAVSAWNIRNNSSVIRKFCLVAKRCSLVLIGDVLMEWIDFVLMFFLCCSATFSLLCFRSKWSSCFRIIIWMYYRKMPSVFFDMCTRNSRCKAQWIIFKSQSHETDVFVWSM